MTVLNTILNIIIFLLCLSFVVCIHEAGHLAVAKVCKVYCFEYSIGFGPLLYKHKFKHKKKKNKNEEILTENLYVASDKKEEKEVGETQLSIRALPLGGYVAMAGEDGNLTEDGKKIPPERCLNGVNHFKQICIMLAGITMNFILAIVLFIIACWLPQTQPVYTGNTIVVSENTKETTYPANDIGLKTGDKILYLYQTFYSLYDAESNSYSTQRMVFPATEEQIEMKDYQVFRSTTDKDTYDDLTRSSISYASQDIYLNYYANEVASGKPAFDLKAYDEEHGTSFSRYVANERSTRTFTITYERDGETKTVTTKPIGTTTTSVNGKDYWGFGKLGITCTTTTYQASFGEGIVMGFKQFGNLFVNLYKALGGLFTPSGWKNVGGIISVYKMSAEGAASGSASYFLLLWGYISLNLGCFNLLPFPGLDGWQTLIALIESITRKKFPTKAKSVANTIGLIIMLALAGLLIVKDIIVGI